jgi:hypothetical protein
MAARILAIASGGGHWIQLRRLYPAFEGLDVSFVSVDPAYRDDVPRHRFYAVRDVNRWHRWGFVVLTFQLLGIFFKERPGVVVTTGAAPGFVALALAKLLFGARTMWIDSIANCETMSGAGQRARRFADAWLTQWPQLSRDEGPQHWGAVL